MCVSGGNGAVGGQSLSIRLIDGSSAKVINPSALHTNTSCLYLTHIQRDEQICNTQTPNGHCESGVQSLARDHGGN